LAAEFGFHRSDWIANVRAGRFSPAKQGRCGGSRLNAHENFIVSMIEGAKDITLNEMVLRLREESAISIGRSAHDAWLRKRGWTFKIRPHMHWSRSVPISRTGSMASDLSRLIATPHEALLFSECPCDLVCEWFCEE